jgi:hypothetical protein
VAPLRQGCAARRTERQAQQRQRAPDELLTPRTLNGVHPSPPCRRARGVMWHIARHADSPLACNRGCVSHRRATLAAAAHARTGWRT